MSHLRHSARALRGKQVLQERTEVLDTAAATRANNALQFNFAGFITVGFSKRRCGELVSVSYAVERERGSAMTCHDCRALLGKTTAVRPHAALLMRDSRLDSSGAVETYWCRDCDTRWHRFKPDLTFRGRPQTWRVLPESVLRHSDTSPRPRV
jgi:hypothetical protein